MALRPPFTSDDRHVLIHEIVDGNPPPLRQINRSIPRDLETIVLKAISSEPQQRYATAQEMADDLARFLADEPIRARRPTVADRAAKWSRRHKALVGSAVSVALLVVVAAGWFAWSGHRRAVELEVGVFEHLAAAEAFLQSRDYTAADRELADARGHLETAQYAAGPLADEADRLAGELAAKQRAGEQFDEFQSLRRRIHSEMYAVDRDILDQAQEHCRRALDLYHAMQGDAWRADPDLTDLSPQRQETVKEGIVELLFVWACIEAGKGEAADPSQREACHRRAIEAFTRIQTVASPIPAVYLWLADSWEALGDKQTAALVRSKANAAQSAAMDYFLLAEHHARHGRPEQAVASYTQALARQPDHYLSLLAAGVALGELKRHEFAEGVLSGVIAINPQAVLAYAKRGLSRLEQGKILLAQADFQEAKKLDPELARALTRRAITYRENYEFDKALADCNEALRLDPKSALAYSERSVLHWIAGNLDAAMADCTQAMRLEPQSASLYALRGDLHRSLGKHAEAMADCSECLRLDPNFAWGYRTRSRLYREKGELEKARADIDQGMRLDPKAGLLGARAQLHRALGESDKALADYDEAIRLAPKDVWAFMERAALHLERGDLSKALADSNEAVRLAPKMAMPYSNRAATYRAKGDFDKALADYSEAIRLNPKNAGLYSDRAAFYRDRGDFDKALADYNEAIRLSPNSADLVIARAEFHKAKGDSDKALADYQKAVALLDQQAADSKASPDLSASLNSQYSIYGNLLRESGRHVDAEKAYRRALALSEKLTATVPENGYYWYQYVDSCGRLIQLLRSTSRNDEAKQLLNGMKNPLTATALIRRGSLFEQLGEPDRAAADFAKANELVPKDTFDYEERAQFYLEKGDFGKAAADYDRAAELHTMSWHLYKRRAVAHFHLKNYDMALASLAKALELGPGDPSSLWWVPPAQVAKCPSEPLRKGLLELADKTIEKTKGSTGAYIARARLLHAFGQPEKARADYAKAIELEPKNDDAWASRARFYLEQGKWDPGIADLSKAVELKPEEGVLWYQRAVARAAAGRVDEYRKDCAEMLKRFGQTVKPDDAHWTAWACAITPDAIKDWPNAIALAEQAVNSHGESTQYRSTAGAVLYRAGRWDEAVQRLAEADRLGKNPSEGQRSSPAYTWYFLAMAHHRLGHGEEAKKWLAKAVAWGEKATREADQGTADMPWNRRLTLKLLREEAEALLKTAPANQTPKVVPKEQKQVEKTPEKAVGGKEKKGP